MEKKIKNIIIISTEFQSIDIFLGKMINILSNKNNILLICNNIYEETRNINLNNNLKLMQINIKRKPNFYYDILTLLKLSNILKKNKKDLVISISPKASFLVSLCRFMFVRKFNLLNYVTGQVWATKSKIPKTFYKLIDQFTFSNSNHNLVDSKSQIDFLSKNGFSKKNFTLINNGSISGVDTNLFSKRKTNQNHFLKKFNLNINDIKIIYIGRLNLDKGLEVLIKSFNELRKKYHNISLLLIGSLENQIISDFIKGNEKILLINKRVNNPEYFLSYSDIFCLPSYREGFGMSVIEASSSELPVITSDIYGLNDCMLDNITGLKFNHNIENDLYSKLEILINNKNLRRQFGEAGRSFIINNFKEDDVINFQLNFIYNKML